ncbi:MAG: hypothetical protein AB1805_08125 [Nitrospirota bacterium]
MKADSRVFLMALLSILAFSQPVYSEIFAGVNTIEPYSPQKRIKPSRDFLTYCYDIFTGTHVPCPFEVFLKGEPEECPQPESLQCGHVDVHHAPAHRNDMPESSKVSNLGGVTDQWQTAPSTSLPERYTTTLAPDYRFTYHSGALSGRMEVSIFASRPPAGYYFLSPPCESNQTCTVYSVMDVGYKGFSELPAPLPRTSSGVSLDDGEWDGYVRCGRTARCSEPVVDDPYNWPAHPHVHWGEDYVIDALWCLSREWYAACGTDLVISDMSLPKGGLLDVNENWSTPHKSHRMGEDTDISAKSVPTNGICGPRPSGGTFDPVWKDTVLRRLAGQCMLRPLKGDPGHLRRD